MKMLIGGVLAFYGLKKIGDIKDLAIIGLVFAIFFGAFLIIPDLQNNDIYTLIKRVYDDLPAIGQTISDLLSGGTS